MKSDDIPDWACCSRKKDDNTDLTALEQFVYNNEPVGTDHAKQFREELLAVINELEN